MGANVGRCAARLRQPSRLACARESAYWSQHRAERLFIIDIIDNIDIIETIETKKRAPTA